MGSDCLPEIRVANPKESNYHFEGCAILIVNIPLEGCCQ
jgi:hypothetical protein